MRLCRYLAAAALATAFPATLDAKDYVKGEYSETRAYSPAVVTEGGKTIWLAGQTSIRDEAGQSLVGNFDGQVRDVFARIGKTLAQKGGSLSDIVTMTVFITDVRNGTRFTELRKEIFKEKFPASALITITGLAQPGMMVEVQAVAVVGDK